jgi:hypothetical protein
VKLHLQWNFSKYQKTLTFEMGNIQKTYLQGKEENWGNHQAKQETCNLFVLKFT